MVAAGQLMYRMLMNLQVRKDGLHEVGSEWRSVGTCKWCDEKRCNIYLALTLRRTVSLINDLFDILQGSSAQSQTRDPPGCYGSNVRYGGSLALRLANRADTTDMANRAYQGSGHHNAAMYSSRFWRLVFAGASVQYPGRYHSMVACRR